VTAYAVSWTSVIFNSTFFVGRVELSLGFPLFFGFGGFSFLGSSSDSSILSGFCSSSESSIGRPEINIFVLTL